MQTSLLVKVAANVAGLVEEVHAAVQPLLVLLMALNHLAKLKVDVHGEEVAEASLLMTLQLNPTALTLLLTWVLGILLLS